MNKQQTKKLIESIKEMQREATRQTKAYSKDINSRNAFEVGFLTSTINSIINELEETLKN
jgi:hypothetical protein